MKEFLLREEKIAFHRDGQCDAVTKLNGKPITLSEDTLRSLNRAPVDRVDIHRVDWNGNGLGMTSITPALRIYRLSPEEQF